MSRPRGIPVYSIPSLIMPIAPRAGISGVNRRAMYRLAGIARWAGMMGSTAGWYPGVVLQAPTKRASCACGDGGSCCAKKCLPPPWNLESWFDRWDRLGFLRGALDRLATLSTVKTHPNLVHHAKGVTKVFDEAVSMHACMHSMRRPSKICMSNISYYS